MDRVSELMYKIVRNNCPKSGLVVERLPDGFILRENEEYKYIFDSTAKRQMCPDGTFDPLDGLLIMKLPKSTGNKDAGIQLLSAPNDKTIIARQAHMISFVFRAFNVLYDFETLDGLGSMLSDIDRRKEYLAPMAITPDDFTKIRCACSLNDRVYYKTVKILPVPVQLTGDCRLHKLIFNPIISYVYTHEMVRKNDISFFLSDYLAAFSMEDRSGKNATAKKPSVFDALRSLQEGCYA